MGSSFRSESSLGAFDFLLSFTLEGGTAPCAAWAKNADTDESRTAMV
jgi:hypothetical protein